MPKRDFSAEQVATSGGDLYLDQEIIAHAKSLADEWEKSVEERLARLAEQELSEMKRADERISLLFAHLVV